MSFRKFAVLLFGFLGVAAALDLKLPKDDKSVRFAIIGDNGTGEKRQYDVADQMVKWHDAFPFDFALMLGDNIYGGKTAADFKLKFEDPYKKLMDSGVKFYASLGNHDDSNERYYKPFNMDGKRYYSFKKGNVTFFALDSTYMSPDQLQWIDDQLKSSDATWKICYYHHPLYSDGTFHGPDLDLRRRLEPIFLRDGVKVVFTGHEHVYERLRPQKGINYFVLGNSGELRVHNLRKSRDTAKGFDTDCGFGLIEISGTQMYYQIVSRIGATIDSGSIDLGANAPASASASAP
jgi:hypothetical protein